MKKLRMHSGSFEVSLLNCSSYVMHTAELCAHISSSYRSFLPLRSEDRTGDVAGAALQRALTRIEVAAKGR